MRVVLLGATGMVGSGALIECLEDPDVTSVLVVGRRTCGVEHDKLAEVIHSDLLELGPITDRLHGLDACFFCLGVSSAGMNEEAYTRITYDMTLEVAEALLEANPEIVFCYISGAGADSSESGRMMWARVRGRIENRLLQMPFKAAFVFRPAFIQPMKGVRSGTALYNAFYAVLGPLYPILARLVRGQVTTTEKLGQALIRAARDGAPKPILETRDINEIAEA